MLRENLLVLLKQCKTLNPLKQIHAQILVGAGAGASLHNHLLSKLVSLRHVSYAGLLFCHLHSPNDFSFNLIIRALASSSSPLLSLFYFRRMLLSGLRPNSFTFPFVLIAAANLPSLSAGRAAHSAAVKAGVGADAHTVHSLITMYSRCGDLGSAREVFDGIAERDLVSWNSMISGYSRMGFAAEAVGLFKEMRVAGFEGDEKTVVSVLAACGDLGDLRLGERLEALVEEIGLELNTFVGSALVDMYGKCGDLVAARRVFDVMPDKEVVVWNAMMTGYAQNGMSDEAIKLFHAMREVRVEPDKITMVGVLSACAAVGALDLGAWVDECALRKGLHENVYVGTALVDMYAKCGNLDRAVEIFNSMPWKNVVCWNAMISGLAFHGRGEEAISLFKHMRNEQEDAYPNDITFIGVLSACVHAGLVDEGYRWFNSMQHEFGIVPKIEHYSCMVDLLARAKRLEEAWEFVEKMPAQPDAVMLGALLCACRNCKNVEIGERVIKRILELEPCNSGNYVISSKIYAGSKRWDDSARMRGLMRERGISKTPGCSWIEVDNKVHEFHAGDGLHHRVEDIEHMIELLVEEMKLEGYIPDFDVC